MVFENEMVMNERVMEITAAIGLFIGAVFGIVGSFTPSATFRGLAWGIDGIGLILASGLLTIYYFRKGLDLTAGGFLIFAIGQSLVLSSSGMNFDEYDYSFGAGTGLWATSLIVIGFQKTYPIIVRIAGLIAAVLFAIVAVQILATQPVNALTKPLPFYAYPIFVVAILGWAWTIIRKHPGSPAKTGAI